MKSSFPLSNEAAVIYTLLFVAIMISCLPKIRCINLDRPKCQFVRRRKQRKEEVDEETGTASYSRTFIDCPLFPCIEFVSETTTSYHSGTDDWYIPSDDSMVDVVINETTYSVPLSLVMPNYTAWKWERERRKMIRNVENNLKPKRSTSLPCINNVCFKTKQHLQRKYIESTALTKSPFTISSKITMETMNENRVDVKGDRIREFREDSNLCSIMDRNKELFSENHSLKNKRENHKFIVNEESQHQYINRSKSLDRENYSMQKALESCREENEMPYGIHCSIDNLSFTYHQDIENNPNMRMKEDLKALESSVYFTNRGKHSNSPIKVSKVKRDVDNKPSHKTKSLTKMESYPKILKCSDGLALHSLGVKVASSKPESSLYRSAESVSAQRTSSKKEDGAYSLSLNCLNEKDGQGGKLFQQKPHSLFTCLKYETEKCPTCDCEFPPKLRNSSSASSRTGTDIGNEAPFILMECEMEICPFLLEETPSGLYLNPSSTSRIVEEVRKDIEVGNKHDPSCKKKSYSSLDDVH